MQLLVHILRPFRILIPKQNSTFRKKTVKRVGDGRSVWSKKAFFHIPASFFYLCLPALLELLHVANYGERNIPKTHDVRIERLFSLKNPSRRCNSIEFRLGSIKGERNNAKKKKVFHSQELWNGIVRNEINMYETGSVV